MIRILSGRLKGRSFRHSLYGSIRPTTSYVREALFNTIGQEQLHRASFLDLFAGTGVVGFEAFSRGADSVSFVESNKKLGRLLRSQKELLGVEGSVSTQPIPQALSSLGRQQKTFDIIFMDPPYGFGDYGIALNLIADMGLLQPGGLVVVERSAPKAEAKSTTKEAMGAPLQQVAERHYGNTRLVFYRH